MIDVFIPNPGWKLCHIDKGSGIVGTATEGDRTLVDYEGNRFGASNIVTFADRVMIAAGRHEESYPTVARAALVPDVLIRVGSYDGHQVTLDHQDLAPALADWIGCPVEDLDHELAHSIPAMVQSIHR